MDAEVKEAIRVLVGEANRVSNKANRAKALKAVAVVRKTFEELDGQKMDGPPGKAVVRNSKGRIIGFQG